MTRVSVIAISLFIILAIGTAFAVIQRSKRDAKQLPHIVSAREMAFLVCEDALPYVTSGKQLDQIHERFTFNVISTTETGGQKTLLCVEKIK